MKKFLTLFLTLFLLSGCDDELKSLKQKSEEVGCKQFVIQVVKLPGSTTNYTQKICLIKEVDPPLTGCSPWKLQTYIEGDTVKNQEVCIISSQSFEINMDAVNSRDTK